MRKLKIIVAAILRGSLVLAPGAVYLWWLWGKVAALVAILAAIGLETLWAIVFSFVVLTIKAWRDQRKETKAAEKDTEEGAEDGIRL